MTNNTKAILKEVEQLFSNAADTKEIDDISKMGGEIRSHCETSILDAKELVKGYTSRVAEKEKEILAPTELVHAANLEKYRDEKENVAKQVENLRNALDGKREKISDVAQKTLSTMEKCSETQLSSQMADSRTAYALSLYTKISNITWDYNAKSGTIAGTIGNDDLKSLKEFSIDTRKNTSYETANQLWSMIGETTL